MIQQNIIIKVLSELELETLHFIHDFGFCEIHHVKQRFNLGRSASYERMKILKRFGLVNHAMILHNRPGVFYLTPQAVRTIHADLPAITQIPRHNYFHHMEIINTYLNIRKVYPDITWITERKLIRESKEGMVGTKTHLPDGVFILADGKRISVEVELNLKSRERLLTILTDYLVDKDVHEVWYFCTPKIKSVLQAMIVKLPKIKLYLLNENIL